MTTPQDLAEGILSIPVTGRRVVALAGPPASGKSTLAQTLAQALRDTGCVCQVVPMDGFHLDNEILKARNQLNRKGSAQTFDAMGFLSLVSRLRDSPTLYYPTFDRTRDLAIAGSGCVEPDCDTVIVEGNYLLYDAPVWRELVPYWDISIRLDVPFETLRTRLVKRWLTYGLSPEDALKRAMQNDLPNAQTIISSALDADVTLNLRVA